MLPELLISLIKSLNFVPISSYDEPRSSFTDCNFVSDLASSSVDFVASPFAAEKAVIPAVNAVMPVSYTHLTLPPVKTIAAGFNDIAIFQAYWAAVASEISPVKAPTAICLSVIVPMLEASARLSAVTAAA